MADADKQKTRLNRLRSIESERQTAWRAADLFKVDPVPGKDKFLVTFPYPYMNGYLHLGHAFSASKAEFTVRFQRMLGKQALFPFGLHVSGMPIVGASIKLRRELSEGGLEHNEDDHEEVEAPAPAPAPAATETEAAPVAFTGQFRSKKGKKADGASWVKIMRSLGVPDAEIPKFVDPAHWLRYFPKRGLESLDRLGVAYDRRRCFITTDANKWYDAFIRWQFQLLRQRGHISYGPRWTIYSPRSAQPCADHDREQGEQVTPQEYTIVKLRVQNPKAFKGLIPFADIIGDLTVVLPCATLRPETMYGQTNAWVSPTGDYGAYRVSETEIYITSARSANNLAWQGLAYPKEARNPPEGPTPLFTINGRDLLGCPLSAPLTPFETIYVLPMESVKLTKGTGVVTSVPADSPDDYINFMQLKTKKEWRVKEYGIEDAWIEPFDIVTVISIPGYGPHAAADVCTKYKITGPKDAVALEEAKKEVYLKGFNEGLMHVPDNAAVHGQPVQTVKRIIEQEMVAAGNAHFYAEPEKLVVSRTGEECVVTLCDQYFIKYGEPLWRQVVAGHVAGELPNSSVGTKGMEFFNPSCGQSVREAIEWLKEWGCSRQIGLGTHLPFHLDEDGNFVDGDAPELIDSLSDSTIYMAFYTIVQYLQADGDLDGTGDAPCGAKPSQFGPPVFDFIFLGDDTGYDRQAALAAEAGDESLVPPSRDLLLKMRAEFEYWYPMDLRVSGKDLIFNHLTMCLYNHAATWGPALMPKAFYCNGHVLVDGEKMSKSKGNFMTVDQAVERFGADAVRLTCAESGDGIDDANFNTNACESSILTLTKELDFITDMVEKSAAGALRTGEQNFFDKALDASLDAAIVSTRTAYERMQFRVGVMSSLRNLLSARDVYRKACHPERPTAGVEALGFHAGTILRWAEVLALLTAPIIPHWSDHVWTAVLKKGDTIVNALWPTLSTGTPVPNAGDLLGGGLLQDAVDNFRRDLTKSGKGKGKPKVLTGVTVYVATHYNDWQEKALIYARDAWAANGVIEKSPKVRCILHNSLFVPHVHVIGHF